MLEINWKPSDRELRQFAVAFLVAAVAIGSVAWWKWEAPTAARILWGLGPIVALLGLLAPKAVKPIFVLLTLVAFPIGMVLGHVLMGLVFYLLLTPVALFFRLLGRDVLHRRYDPEASTYWIRRRPPADASRYFRQF